MNDELPALRALGEQLERVARADEQSRAPRRRRWAAVFTGLALVSASGVALAASGILTGSPVSDPKGLTAQPNTEQGTVIASSVRLLSLRVRDPDGGPPWGLRTLRTTRQLGCVQLGRVVDGKLGVLGEDGAFGGDGRFHPLGSTLIEERECQPLDAAGHTFLAIAYSGLPASAAGGSCTAPAAHRRFLRGPTHAAPIRSCPPVDERIIAYGLLGPRATAVSYADAAGHTHTAATIGPDGAYLVVQRPSRTHPALGYYSPSASPGSQLASVTYRDGHVCHLRSPRAIGGARPCPLVGYVAPRPAKLTDAQIRSPVSARLSSRPVLVPTGPDNKPTAPAAWKVTLSFTSRVAAKGRDSYTVTYALHGHSPHCAYIITGPVEHDVDAGDHVTQDQYLSTRCPSRVRFQIRLHRPTRPDDFFARQPQDPLVGTVVVSIPQRP